MFLLVSLHTLLISFRTFNTSFFLKSYVLIPFVLFRTLSLNSAADNVIYPPSEDEFELVTILTVTLPFVVVTEYSIPFTTTLYPVESFPLILSSVIPLLLNLKYYISI